MKLFSWIPTPDQVADAHLDPLLIERLLSDIITMNPNVPLLNIEALPMDAASIRTALEKIIDFGIVAAKWTPTAADDVTLELLRKLVDAPGVLEQLISIFAAKGITFDPK